MSNKISKEQLIKILEVLEIDYKVSDFNEKRKDEPFFSSLDYVIVRTYSAGVFAGYLVDKKGKEVALKNARRLWHWEGAATLSQLAEEGVSQPKACKFPCEVNRVLLIEAIEILAVSEKAKENIQSVPVWTA